MKVENFSLNIPNVLVLVVCIIVLIITFLMVILLIFYRSSKSKKDKTSDTLLTLTIDYLGGKENIKNVAVENARLKVTLNDLKMASLENLKEVSPKGVFITNNDVKLLVSYDAKKFKQLLEKNLKN